MTAEVRERVTISEPPGHGNKRWRFFITGTRLTEGNLHFRYDPADYPSSKNYQETASFKRLPVRVQVGIDRLLQSVPIVRLNLLPPYVQIDVADIHDWVVVQPAVMAFLTESYFLRNPEIKFNAHF